MSAENLRSSKWTVLTVISFGTLMSTLDGGMVSVSYPALAEMWGTGCRFLVAGREDNGVFYTLDDVDVPQGFSPLFQEIPESRFRKDISSTALRGEC